MRQRNKYTSEHIDFLKKYNNVQILNKDLAVLFTKQFGLVVTPGDITSLKYKNGIKSNYHPSRFKKGYVNKCEYNLFKKGQTAFNIREVGHTWIDKEGYTYIKIAMPSVWELKHRFLYEKYNNIKLSKNEVVIFLDKDKTNFSKQNLHKIQRRQLGLINKFLKDKPVDRDITLSMCKLTELMIKAKELRRKKK